MTALVFGMSVLLVLVGAASVITGAPIIQIERGWAEVIAGAVAVSGGAVTFAIAVVLLRLKALHRAIGGVSLHLSNQNVAEAAPVIAPVASEVPPMAHTIEPVLRPTRAPEDAIAIHDGVELPEATPSEALVVAPAPPPASEPRVSLWKRVSRPARSSPVLDREPAATIVPETPSPHEELAPPDIRVETPDPANAPTSAETPGLEVESPKPEEDLRRPRRLVTPPTPVADSSERPARTGALARDWLTQPLLRSRSLRSPETEALPPLFDSPPEREETVSLSAAKEEPATEVDEALLERGGEKTQPRSENVEAPAAPEDLAVIGRYKAGASSYTMYSDGSIDVETEAGDVHRFASMDELKAFIARQESALS